MRGPKFESRGWPTMVAPQKIQNWGDFTHYPTCTCKTVRCHAFGPQAGEQTKKKGGK